MPYFVKERSMPMASRMIPLIAAGMLLSGWVEAIAWTDLKGGADTTRILHVKSGTRQKLSGVKYKVVGCFSATNSLSAVRLWLMSPSRLNSNLPGRWRKGAAQGAAEYSDESRQPSRWLGGVPGPGAQRHL